MSDLIERGRVWTDQLDCADVPLVNELCDEIERLTFVEKNHLQEIAMLEARVETLEGVLTDHSSYMPACICADCVEITKALAATGQGESDA